MHEMSLAVSVLQVIEDTAKQQDAQRITAVRLEIGQLAGVEIEALKFCFDAVVRDSIAADARLEITIAPGAGWCMQCSQSVPLTEVFGACPQCGRHQVQVTGGEQMRVCEIEVN